MSQDLISVIENLLKEDVISEAKENSVNKKNLTSDGKTADSKTIDPKSGNASNNAKEVGVGKAMTGKEKVLGSMMGAEDEGGSKGDNPSDAADNSAEIGIKKSMDGDKSTKVVDALSPTSQGKVPNKDKGFPSDASPTAEPNKGPHKQANEEKETDDDEESVDEMKDMDKDDKEEVEEEKEDKEDKDEVEEEKSEDSDKEEVEESEMNLKKPSMTASNDPQRPPEERGDNAPVDKGGNVAAGPHNQSSDKIEEPIKADKKMTAEEKDEDEEKDSVEEKKAPVTDKEDDGEGMDPVGKEDDDVNNDGKEDESDDYLEKKREKVSQATGNEKAADHEKKLAKEEADEEDDKDKVEEAGGKTCCDQPDCNCSIMKEEEEEKSDDDDSVEEAKDKDENDSEEESWDEAKDEDESKDLDEEFKEKAQIIFETAVNEKVSNVREELQEAYDAKLAEEVEAMNEKIDGYVDYAVQEWIKENQLEIKYSLRTEIAENFIKGLKGLFEDNFIDIPEDDISVVDELTETVEGYKEQLEEKEELLEAAQKELLVIKHKEIVDDVANDLTETQKIRLEKLSESVEASDIEEFRYKVESLKESYFDPSAEQPLLGSLSEEVFGGAVDLEESTDAVSQYANFLSKTVKK